MKANTLVEENGSGSEAIADHTPGPWTVYRKGPVHDYTPYQIGSMDGDRLGVRVASDVSDSADARLIAEAPRLLDDLEELMKACMGTLPYNHPALVNARATRDRARGESVN